MKYLSESHSTAVKGRGSSSVRDRRVTDSVLPLSTLQASASSLHEAADVKSGFTSFLRTAYFLVYSFRKVEDQVLNLHAILGVHSSTW